MKKRFLHFLFLLIAAPAIITAQPQSGLQMFDNSLVHEIRVSFPLSYPTFFDSLEYYYDQALNFGAPKKYMMATTVSIDGTVIDSCGMREKGFFSNWGAFGQQKKPFKISFNEYVNGQKYDGLKKINLANGFEDPTVMRDVLAYKILRDAGITVPRTSYAKLYINNMYWGLYVVVEEPDKTFLKENFSDNDGNLYECINNTNLSWNGTNWASYTGEFELKTNTTNPNTSDFIRFVNIVNNNPAATFRDSLDKVFETDNYLKTLAADILMLNWDSYYDHGRNFQLYTDSDNVKINWIPWDYNLAFSDVQSSLIINFSSPQEKPLVQRCQADDTLRRHYLLHVCELMETVFNHPYLDTFIVNTAQLIRPSLLLEQSPFFSITDFDNNINTDISVNGGMGLQTYKGLKQFISERLQAVTTELNSYGVSCSPLSVTDPNPDARVSLYPNPSRGDITLECMGGFGSKMRYTIYDSEGRLCLEGNSNAGETKIRIETESLHAGFYLVSLDSDDGLHLVKRFVRQ